MSKLAAITRDASGIVDSLLIKLNREDEISIAAKQYLNIRRVDGKRIKRSEIDLEFTRQITSLVRGMDKDFEKVVVLVKKSPEDIERGQLGIEVQPEINIKSKNLIIEFNELKTTRFILRILQDKSMKEFHEGIKLVINHEIGHAKAVRIGLKSFDLDNVKISVGLFEPLAQLYALGKAANPIEAMASASAICHFVENTEVVEDTVREWLSHLYFDITVTKGGREEVGPINSLMEMKTESFAYLRNDVESEIIKVAEKLVLKLEKRVLAYLNKK